MTAGRVVGVLGVIALVAAAAVFGLLWDPAPADAPPATVAPIRITPGPAPVPPSLLRTAVPYIDRGAR